jgi:hypothetical protein
LKSVAGTQRGLNVHLTAARMTGSLLSAASIDSANPSSAVTTNRVGTGATSVTVVGSNVGSNADRSGYVSISGTVLGVTVWMSETALMAKGVAGGSFSCNSVASTIGQQIGTVGNCASFDAPSLSGVVLVNAASTGASSVTVVGRHARGSTGGSAVVRIAGCNGMGVQHCRPRQACIWRWCGLWGCIDCVNWLRVVSDGIDNGLCIAELSDSHQHRIHGCYQCDDCRAWKQRHN